MSQDVPSTLENADLILSIVLEGYKTLSGKEWNLKAPEQSSVADDDEVVVTPPPRPGPPVYLLRR
jgi:hypothetical protein